MQETLNDAALTFHLPTSVMSHQEHLLIQTLGFLTENCVAEVANHPYLGICYLDIMVGETLIHTHFI